MHRTIPWNMERMVQTVTKSGQDCSHSGRRHCWLITKQSLDGEDQTMTNGGIHHGERGDRVQGCG